MMIQRSAYMKPKYSKAIRRMEHKENEERKKKELKRNENEMKILLIFIRVSFFHVFFICSVYRFNRHNCSNRQLFPLSFCRSAIASGLRATEEKRSTTTLSSEFIVSEPTVGFISLFIFTFYFYLCIFLGIVGGVLFEKLIFSCAISTICVMSRFNFYSSVSKASFIVNMAVVCLLFVSTT